MKCCLCRGVFHQVRSLACGHGLCLTCAQSQVTELIDETTAPGGAGKSILICPVCRCIHPAIPSPLSLFIKSDEGLTKQLRVSFDMTTSQFYDLVADSLSLKPSCLGEGIPRWPFGLFHASRLMEPTNDLISSRVKPNATFHVIFRMNGD